MTQNDGIVNIFVVFREKMCGFSKQGKRGGDVATKKAVRHVGRV